MYLLFVVLMDNTTCATFLYMMMNFDTQSIIINKRLAQELGLNIINLKPCSFVIITFIGGTKWTINYTM